MTALVLRADARCLPLPDDSVDLIVTSPPYWGLRSYTDGGEHYAGQIGDEATPAEYVESLLDCTREWMRVLKPTGSLFVNLDDKFANRSGTGWGSVRTTNSRGKAETIRNATPNRRPDTSRSIGFREKSLIGLPWRYAIACVDDLGLILRTDLVWSKPAGLPESVTDRVKRDHEYWFHLVKQPRYYAATDELRTPLAAPGRRAGRAAFGARDANHPRTGDGQYDGQNPLGALPGSVWTIATEPLRVPEELGVDHHAAFPTEWPRRLVLGWSPPGICVECGSGRRPFVTSVRMLDGVPRNDLGTWDTGIGAPSMGAQGVGHWRFSTERQLLGYACACAEATAPTRPAVVLDPFGGTGTTALVASVLGRVGISIDRAADYCRIARWRTTDRGQIAKAMRVAKPPAEAHGQASLFGDV